MRGYRIWTLAVAILGLALHCSPGFSQAIVSEDFTGTSTSNPWYYFNGACLTASTGTGTGTSGSVAGTPPGCTTLQSYYDGGGRSDTALVGGWHGTATGSTAWNSSTPLDPSGNGALRFTQGCINGSANSCGNGNAGGHSENGLIISGNTYSTDQGLDITFKTVTYRGDSGGNGANCPSGSSASNGQCTSSVSSSATPSYSCPSGYSLSGSNCTTSATPTFTGYTCPSGYTLSGSTCTERHQPTIAATANYSCPSGYTKSGSGSSTACTKTVAATASYSCPSGYTLSGQTCSETTVVDATDPHQTDGADGISFFLMDGTQPVTFGTVGNFGSWGGSLGYTCSNSNTPYNGLVGGYIGLGIDEYGNFLNGTQNTLGVTKPQSMGDNTASGGGQWANRIGLRGAGNVSWYWLNANYPTYYPSSLTSSQQNSAVQATCETGTLWNYSTPAAPINTNGTSATINNVTGPTLYDYAAIAGGYAVLPASVQIANEYSTGGYSRQPYSTTSGTYGTGANPITYDLKITANGVLSLSYSYNGGAWTNVIKNQSIANSNIALPSKIRFGFAGSTGGSSNIHEVLCFKVAAASQAASSTTVNQQQSSKVETGSQAYFGYYDPQNWTGALTANALVNTGGVLTISSPPANWDGSCVLTGVASGSSCGTTGQSGPVAAQNWITGSNGRVILTWSGTAGIPFEWTNLTSAEQSALDAGDSSQTADRLQYLRGDPAEEIENGGTFRNLDSQLADIIDSSSAWVGPPSKSVYDAYETPAVWADKLYPLASVPENSGQTYSNYVTAEATRLNIVYVGANDGFLHGFSAGSWDTTGTVYNSSLNTGQEMLAYMPQGVLQSIHNATNSWLDYSNPQYGHNFFVDATPATGDLFYQGNWHTWAVGGLGPGGSEIYALDVTTPGNFTESNASTLVMGDWLGGTSSTNPGSFTCANSANCALNLGNTYGTPTIRRLHNGDWALIFGNGLNSSTGDAGIFILTIDPSSGTQTMYYLSTGKTGASDGIAYAHPVDLDQDHVVDYVYAGDVLGNVWRFDLTSDDPNAWAVTPGPLFTTPSQPITSDVYPVFVQGTAGVQLMLFFGTGQKFPLTQSTATTYATGQQSFYGIWDWNMSVWNGYNHTQFASMPAGTLTSAMTISNLQQQTVTVDSGLPSIDLPYVVCYAGTTTCNTTTVGTVTGSGSTATLTCTSSVGGLCSSISTNTQYGWYINLPGSNSAYGSSTSEQDIYNPILVTTAIQFNSILPAIDSPLMCTPDHDQGWSYALNVENGIAQPNFFVNNGNTHTIALQTNASGSSSEVTTTNANGTVANYYLIYQSTSGGAGTPTQINPGNNISGNRETWIQLR
jgi:type IV pilus assembly protein PilY1